MDSPNELWRVARVAQHLDVSRKRVYHLIREGRLEAVRLSQRSVRVMRRSVDGFVRDAARREKWHRSRQLAG
jgi:excisionase family DNA binding protein